MTEINPEVIKSEAKPESKPHVFVVNEYVLKAKKSSLLKGWKRFSKIEWILFTLLFGSLASLIIIYSFNLNSSVDSGVIQLLGLISAFCSFAVMAMYAPSITRRGFPSNFIVDERGLRFSWRYFDNKESRILPFSRLTSLYFYGPNQKLLGEGQPVVGEIPVGSSLLVSYDLTGVSLKSRFSLLRDTTTLWPTRGARQNSLDVLKAKSLNLELPLDAFTLESDKERLVAIFDDGARDDVKHESFLQLKSRNFAPTYTKLWLDELNSFKRQRQSDLPDGTVLAEGRYVVSRRMATGGQAKIYLAEEFEKEISLGPVIVKEFVLPVHGGADVRQRSFANVKKEAMMLGALDHPGIVKLLNNFVEDHRAYLILEHIDGKTLKEAVEESGLMSVDKVKSIAKQVLELLSYLHEQSPPIVHRDLTPDNLMINASGLVKLIDFNVARELESGSTRTVVGKHNYMAPEQFKGKACPQSDLYSLGASLHYLLTGKEPTPLSVSKPSADGADASLDAFVSGLTATKLEERAATAKDALTLLAKN